MMKHMDEIEKADLIAEDAKRTCEEVELRESCKTEIDDLWKNAGTPVKFLGLLEKNYPSYSGKQVKFTEKA